MWPKELFTHTFMVTVKTLVSIIDIIGKYEVLLSVEMGHLNFLKKESLFELANHSNLPKLTLFANSNKFIYW